MIAIHFHLKLIFRGEEPGKNSPHSYVQKNTVLYYKICTLLHAGVDNSGREDTEQLY